MVTRVGDLPPHIGEATTSELLLMDATTFALTRIPSERFRGAGIFTGESVGTPSTDWFGVDNGGAYKRGDVYIQTNGSDVRMWQWSEDQDTWVPLATITAPAFHTARSLGVDTYDLMVVASGDTADESFAIGDFYRNTTLRRLYGPYHETEGFNFDPLGEGFVYERGPTRHSNIGADRDITTWNPSLVIDLTEDAYMPRDGDTYLQVLVDTIHGGYLYDFSTVDYEADGGDHAAKLLAGWGTRRFARDPRVFNHPDAPVDVDHLTYITGDYWYSIDNQVLYGPYDATADVVTGDAADHVIAAWGNDPAQSRSTKIHSVNHEDVTLTPAIDNNIYVAGDTLLVGNPHPNVALPILYGPYLDDGSPWPELGSLRGIQVFDIEMLVGTGGTFGGYPSFLNIDSVVYDPQGTPFVGDILRLVPIYPDDHAFGVSGERTGARVSLVVTDVDRLTGAIAWTTSTADTQPRRLHVNQLVGRLPPELDIYTAGDLLMDASLAVFGPFNPSTDIELAWPVFKAAQNRVFNLSTPDANMQPPAPANTYADGDILYWELEQGLIHTILMYVFFDDAWVYKSAARPAVIWDILQEDGVFPVINNVSAQQWVDAGVPVAGDIINLINTYSTGNQFGETVGERTGRASRILIASVDLISGTLTLDINAIRPATVTHNKDTAGRWERDDTVFRTGDFLFDGEGNLYGPYDHTQATDELAWPLKYEVPAALLRIQGDTAGVFYTIRVDSTGNTYTEEIE